jgi:hypothetical protein
MNPVNLQAQFLAIAKDPRIIPGVHHHCDEWCEYCSVTQRCLGFRCTEEFRKVHHRRPGEPTFKALEEAIAFTHEVAAVEGGTTLELDALLDAGSDRESLSTSDPVAALALDYAVFVSQCSIPDGSAERLRDSEPGGPTAKATILWHHVRIYLRVVRALVARQRGERGLSVTPDDAEGSGKLVLVAIEQSRRAWHSLRTAEHGVEVDNAITLLNQIERRIDDRLPGARSFIRIGLDIPAAAV